MMKRVLLAIALASFAIIAQAQPYWRSGGGYTTIQDDGTGLTARTTLNFIGAGVACVDNAGATKTDCTISAGGDALVANPLSQFAATTSAQLAGVISNELGTGSLIFSAGTLNILSGKTLTVSETMTLTGTAAQIYTFPTTSATIARTDAGQTFTGTQAFGALTATTLNGNTWTTGTGTLNIVAGKTATVSNTLTLAGTDATTMTFPSVSATITRTVASGAKALLTAAIASATCTAAQTDTATGTLTTDALIVSFNGDPTAVTGYVPLTTGMLTIIPYPTADTFNVKVCNNSSASITPGAITLNWRVVR